MQKFLGNPLLTLGNIANFGIIGDRKTILRFLATESGQVERFNWWWRAREAGYQNPKGKWSYSAGDGGVYRLSLHEDQDGQPAVRELNSATFTVDLQSNPATGPDGARNSFRPVSFSGQSHLEAGRWYNLIIQNTHPSPLENYVSLNGTFSRNKEYSDASFSINESKGKQFKHNSGSLTYLPAWALTLRGGKQIGQPYQYGDYWTGQYSISGQYRVEQAMQVRQPIELSRLNVWTTRLHGATALRANVFVDNQWLVHADFPAGRIPEFPLPERAGPINYSSPRDFESFQKMTAEIGRMQVMPGQEVRVQFLTAEGSRYYVPASVRAGTYTGIDSNLLSTPGAARFSVDSGRYWYNWQLRSGKSTDSIALSVWFD